MDKFYINSIELKNNDETLSIFPKKINLIIGPNNSGKSRILKEIRDYLSGEKDKNKIVQSIKFELPPTFESFMNKYNINKRIFKDEYGNVYLKAYSNRPIQSFDPNISIENYSTRQFSMLQPEWRDWLSSFYPNLTNDEMAIEFLKNYGTMFYQYLGTEDRLTVINKQRRYGLQENNTNFLTIMQNNTNALKLLSSYIKKLFRKDVILDTYTLGSLIAFRIGDNFDFIRDSKREDCEIINSLIDFNLLDDEGDGIKSFTSTFLTIHNDDNDILLIDEPEAFLHPPLSRQLGETIGEIASRDKQIFISTHSVELLKGIISSCDNVNIIRVERLNNGGNRIKIIDQNILHSILSNPLLRVSRVLEGLFCEKVVITEAEADELFYQEMVEKIKPQSGIYFAHGQNKQTIADIAKMYKKLGVNFAMISDFDVIRVRDEFNKFLSIYDEDEICIQTKQKYRQVCKEARKIVNDNANGNNDEKAKFRDLVYHEKGIKFFEKEAICEEICSMINTLREMGFIILKSGELETSLQKFELPYSNKKSKWITQAIEKISILDKEDIEKTDKELFDNLVAIIKK